ncbi:hypothetical protein M422DRAFT_194145, partial [Sphaerobolus stellatus SS14]
RGHLMHSTRKSDGITVALKLVYESKHPHEVQIARFFSDKNLASDPRNHCVPILDALSVSGYEGLEILVMPFLRPFNYHRMVTVGEAIDFFQQTFEGLQFMHNNKVAHRDCAAANIMMDPSSSELQILRDFNLTNQSLSPDVSRLRIPKHYTRTKQPPKYYFIDFGISAKFETQEPPHLVIPVLGLDRTVPEFQGEGSTLTQDPFPTDVYYLGNMIRQHFLYVSFFKFRAYANLEFMCTLVASMVHDDPRMRPNMDEVVVRFDTILNSLHNSDLRARLVGRQELQPGSAFKRWRNDLYHFLLTLRHNLAGRCQCVL